MWVLLLFLIFICAKKFIVFSVFIKHIRLIKLDFDYAFPKTVFKQLLAVVWIKRFRSDVLVNMFVSPKRCVSVASVWHPLHPLYFFFFFCKHFPSHSPCDFPLSPPGRKEEGGVIQAGSPEHPFWSCSEEHGLGNLCSAESRLQREADRGRGYTGERGCNGEWRREREREWKKEREAGDMKEEREQSPGRGW